MRAKRGVNMNVTGIIAEYNPLHNGHFYHIQQTRKVCNAKILIAVMSGNFVQRGEPAIVSKWERTKMALHAGIDLVLELPFLFATQNAERFSDAAVCILKYMQAQNLVFGSESGELTPLKRIAKILLHPDQAHFKQERSIGYARQMENTLLNTPELIPYIKHPNHILGIQYIRSILAQNAKILPITIQRKGSSYHHSEIVNTGFSSATAIRKLLFEERKVTSKIQTAVPEMTAKILNQVENYIDWNTLFPYLQIKVATNSANCLKQHLLVHEGIENRIKKIIPYETDFYDCMKRLKTKRYTWTRLMRTLLHITLSTHKKWESFSYTNIPYIKILGFNDNGRSYVKQMKKICPVPLISLPKETIHPLIDLEEKADIAYALLHHNLNRRTYLLKRRLQGPVLY